MDYQTSTKQKESLAIQEKLPKVLEFFKTKGQNPDTPVTEDLWFFHDIGQNPKHLLWQVLANCQQKCDPNSFEPQQGNDHSDIITVEIFSQELLDVIKTLHLEILDRQINQDYLKDGQESLQKAEKKIKSERYDNQENSVAISYCKNKAFMSEIFQHYSIKYRIATVHQNYQSIYAEDSNRSSILAIDPLDEKIFFSILGKRLDKSQDGDFKQLVQIELPIVELFQSIKPRHFSLQTIPECYLIINYTDQSLDAPYLDENFIEVRFDLHLEKDRRLLVVEQLQKDNTKIIEELELKIRERIEWMDQLLSIFKGGQKNQISDLSYVRARGIGQAKDFPPQDEKEEDPDKIKDRQNCCILY